MHQRLPAAVSRPRLHCDTKIISCMRCRQLVRDLSGAASQFRFGGFSPLLLPIANFNLDLFKMRRSRIDLVQYFNCSCVVFESGQWRDVRFFARQRFKLLLLPGGVLFRPSARRVAGNRFDPANSGRDRFLLYNSERAYFVCQSHLSPAAQLHRITVERARRPPICRTRTVSPYFSPKNWMMSVRFLTSAYGISVHETAAFSAILSLTSFSTSRACCFVRGALEKSNVSLSGPT